MHTEAYTEPNFIMKNVDLFNMKKTAYYTCIGDDDGKRSDFYTKWAHDLDPRLIRKA